MIPLRNTMSSARFPAVTVGIICVNALIFLVEINLNSELLRKTFETWGIVPTDFTHPRLRTYFTLISSMFLHAGWAHIAGNMWLLWIFGGNIENRMGRAGFLCFYLLSGIAAGIGHIVTNPSSGNPTIGASGAVAGVMGAYLMLYPHARVTTIIPLVFLIKVVELPAIFFLGFWFVIQVFSGSLALATAGPHSAGVAWWAHIGGFVVGALGALIIRLQTRLQRRRYTRYHDDDDFWG